MHVTKRDNLFEEFDISRIRRAIESACVAIGVKLPEETLDMLVAEIQDEVTGIYEVDKAITVDDIQQVVIFTLMNYDYTKPIAEEYVIYKYIRDTRRGEDVVDTGLLSSNFMREYKHKRPPMTDFGNLVYLRTYARYLDEESRREFWWEVVRRSVEYNCSLVSTTKEEAEQLFDNIFNLRQFLSGRTHWVGGTEAARKYPISNYNCAFVIIDSFEAYRDLFYVLMVGTGGGIRVLKDDVAKLPPLRTDIKITHEEFNARSPKYREEYTSLEVSGTTAAIIIGDSKEGWAEAIDIFFKLTTSHMYRKVDMICINYDNIRPAGEPLVTFGGVASGHNSILIMFQKIWKIVQSHKSTTNIVKLRPIDCADIANIIGENVVAGGVRRTSEIILFDTDDHDLETAKTELYVNGKINKAIEHRRMSNNTKYYTEMPTYDELKAHVYETKRTGEPGFLNAVAAAKRRPNFNGVNPCGEILLDNRGLCNLTTVNVYAFVLPDGTLDMSGLVKAMKLSARASYRMTFVKLELPKWDIVQQRDKLIGCSMTGWQDMVNATNISIDTQISILITLRETVHECVSSYAKELNAPEPVAMTTVKPEGTLSQLPTVSSGVHYSHSPYYIRRIRISAVDPLIKACEALNYPIFPEVGQEMETCDTKVIEFPVKAPMGKTKADVSAIEQLNNYLMFMEYYVDHNCSITIHVRENEWDTIIKAIYDNWDDIVAITLIPYNDSVYQLLPYEEITEEEFLKRSENLVPITPSMLRKFEKRNKVYDIIDDNCVGGQCPVR